MEDDRPGTVVIGKAPSTAAIFYQTDETSDGEFSFRSSPSPRDYALSLTNPNARYRLIVVFSPSPRRHLFIGSIPGDDANVFQTTTLSLRRRHNGKRIDGTRTRTRDKITNRNCRPTGGNVFDKRRCDFYPLSMFSTDLKPNPGRRVYGTSRGSFHPGYRPPLCSSV